jgi:hypothetical protein
VLEVFEDVWLILFTLELMLKLVAIGFLPFARSKWNILDFVVRSAIPCHSIRMPIIAVCAYAGWSMQCTSAQALTIAAAAAAKSHSSNCQDTA